MQLDKEKCNSDHSDPTTVSSDDMQEERGCYGGVIDEHCSSLDQGFQFPSYRYGEMITLFFQFS